MSGVPQGVIGGLRFHRNSRDLGFVVNSARSPSDVYSLDTASGKLDRWTYSETGGLSTANFALPQLIKWQTFDGKTLSGFLYSPDPKKFSGKRPVIVNIHGGPEAQFRPVFLGRNNYLVFPNVRGSTGYGKTFLKLDNGFHRDDTYKDIGALLDWIKLQPALDGDKIMITGGSYGGHMTYAVATFYSDKICCSLAVVGITNLVSLLGTHRSLPPRPAARGIRRRARSKDARIPGAHRALQQLREDSQAAVCRGRQKRSPRALERIAPDSRSHEKQRYYYLVSYGQ